MCLIIAPCSIDNTGYTHVTCGNGSCFIKTHNINTRKRFDTIALLNKHVLIGKLCGSYSKNGRRKQHQALRNHPHRSSYCLQNGVDVRLMVDAKHADKQQYSKRNKHHCCIRNNRFYRNNNFTRKRFYVFCCIINFGSITIARYMLNLIEHAA